MSNIRINTCFFILVLFMSCKTVQQVSEYNPRVFKERQAIKLSSSLYKQWQHKDPIEDTIPGVSSDKLYKLIKNKPIVSSKKIIVAVLDSGIDIEHEDLKGSIWTNKGEIPQNGLDDDKNGYVDDIHGWNFLGNKNGENLLYANTEFVRILKSQNIEIENSIPPKNIDSITREAFILFKKAQTELLEGEKYIAKKKSEYYGLKNFFLDNYNLDTISIESLSSIEIGGNEDLESKIKKMAKILRKDRTEKWIKSYEDYNATIKNYKLNLSYNDRSLIGDDINDINDIDYGNSNIIPDDPDEFHGTMVAGIIAANRTNQLGIKGIANNTEIMSLRVIPRGDEYDKDVALAIRYAVDNGANIINMSFGKRFSPKKEFVFDAIKYAAKKNVLIFHAAGNEGSDLDKNKFYPDDNIGFGEEFCKNYINVGASNQRMDLKLPSYYSNYGKRNVDIFAPGYKIYTTTTNNKYDSESGTSLATPIVSGAAALLMSYFPEFDALEIKNILFQSGNIFDVIVRPPSLDDDRVNFSQLSKTGKTLNIYNAFILADELSKKNN